MIIDRALAKGGYEIGLHYQIRGIYGQDAWPTVLQWYHPIDAYPTEQSLLTWWTQCQADEAAALSLKAEKAALKVLMSDANQHAAKIKLIFTAIVTSDKASENVNDRFLRITGALNDPSIPNGFRNLVLAAFTSETGLTVNLGALELVVIGTRQSFNSFARRFFTVWALMLSIANDS